MRNDSVLYTGMTSASTRKVADHKKQLKEKKNEERIALLPAGDVVLDLLDKEIASLPSRVYELINFEDSETHIKSKLMALRMYESELSALKRRVVSTLKIKQEEQDV